MFCKVTVVVPESARSGENAAVPQGRLPVPVVVTVEIRTLALQSNSILTPGASTPVQERVSGVPELIVGAESVKLVIGAGDDVTMNVVLFAPGS